MVNVTLTKGGGTSALRPNADVLLRCVATPEAQMKQVVEQGPLALEVELARLIEMGRAASDDVLNLQYHDHLLQDAPSNSPWPWDTKQAPTYTTDHAPNE